MTTRFDLRDQTLGAAVGATVREARALIGWSQRELAARAGTSQATVWRIETDRAGRLDARVVDAVLRALGLRATLEVDGRHLDDRRRQRDRVHAVLVEETKTDLPDIGGLQRAMSFYRRTAWDAARAMGWRPRTAHVLVVCLDSSAMRRRLADNRGAISSAFPARVDVTLAWLRDPSAPPPQGWTIALADPATRPTRWLRAALGTRRSPAPYEHYADAVRRLDGDPGAGRRGGSRPGPATLRG
ncbi:MAG TPA: helix-turn-helix transcriptional regulator [Candidatus Limnocylindrales bacterium]|nr:helix-turn-helix transcriptional regulator [Candidatus Limnocylindrales bacterium]